MLKSQFSTTYQFAINHKDCYSLQNI